MQIDEKIYHEYAAWQLDNNEVVKKIKDETPNLYLRVKHVFDVIDYLYVKLTEDSNYSKEEDEIFKTGYYYVANQIIEIKEIVKKYYNNDFKLANKNSNEINLLLNTMDFQAEVYNSKFESKTEAKDLLLFDQKIITYLSKQKQVPKKVYNELDDLLTKVFDINELNYLTINNIFLEIADELNIL